MKKCPKCGETYSDSDLRSMCGSCMVSLVSAPDADPLAQMQQAGPISIGPDIQQSMAMPEPMASYPQMTMPEITIPDITPVDMPVPEMPPPPKEAPMQAPPRVVERPAKPISHPPQTFTKKAPEYTQPEATFHQPTASTAPEIARRVLRPDELQRARTRSTQFGVGGAVCILIALLTLFNSNSDNFTPFTLIVIGGLTALSIYLIRKAILDGAVAHAEFALIKRSRIGEDLPMEVNIAIIPDVEITSAYVIVRAEEIATKSGGKSSTVSRQEIFAQRMRLPAPARWPGGSELTFHPVAHLPVGAIPSFSGQRNKIKWTAHLHVEIPGWYPDVHKQIPLEIPALRTTVAPLAVSQLTYALPAMPSLRGQISFPGGLSPANVAILQAGQQVPFTLTIDPTEDSGGRPITVEISCIVYGSGDTENIAAARVNCFNNGFRPGGAQTFEGEFTIPRNGPITYHGTHVQVAWRMIIGVGNRPPTNRRQEMEIMVIPAEA